MAVLKTMCGGTEYEQEGGIWVGRGEGLLALDCHWPRNLLDVASHVASADMTPSTPPGLLSTDVKTVPWITTEENGRGALREKDWPSAVYLTILYQVHDTTEEIHSSHSVSPLKLSTWIQTSQFATQIQDSAVGIVTKLLAERPGIKFSAAKWTYCLKCPNRLWGRNRVPLNVCGTSHTAIQWLEIEADHTASSYAEDKNKWSFETTLSTPTCLHGVHLLKKCDFFMAQRTIVLHYRGFTITLRHTTWGRTPLDERSARRRELYLTAHNIQNRQTSMSPGWDLNLQPQQTSGRRPTN